MARALVALLVLCASALAQDPPPGLTPRVPAAGDRVSIKVESVLELDVTTTDSQGTAIRQLSLVRTDEFTQTTLQEAEGARQDRIVCSSSSLQTAGTNQTPRTDPTDIHDKVFVSTRTAKGRALKMENGDTAPIDAAGVGAWDEAAALLPKGEPKEGAVWTVDASALAGLIWLGDQVSGQGAFEVKLEKLAEGKAVVAFTGLIDGKTSRGASVKLNVTGGRLEWDAVAGKARSLTVTGTLESTQDIVQRVPRPGELKTEDKVGTVQVKSRRLEVKVTWS